MRARYGLGIVITIALGCSPAGTGRGFGRDASGAADALGNGGATGGGQRTGAGLPVTRAQCLDGQYVETLPAQSTDISAILSAAADPQTLVLALLEARYPIGRHLVDGAKDVPVNQTSQNCVAFFLKGFPNTPEGIIEGLGTVVHECGHVLDSSLGFDAAHYVVRQDLQFACEGGSISDFGGKTFARSLIKSDPFAALHTPCQSFGDSSCQDTYAGIYLNGDPTDANFESGDQGFDTVLEETLQYVNSLATAYAFLDQASPFGATSDRDGILTFLWYLERYLRLARLEHPETYTLLSEDTCWREAILTVWGRAWLYLQVTEGIAQLGLEDAKLKGLVTDPELLGEIDALRQRQGCP